MTKRRGRRRLRRWAALALFISLLWVGGSDLLLLSRAGSRPTEVPTVAQAVHGATLAASSLLAASPVELTVAATVARLQDQDRFFGRIAAVRADLQAHRVSAAYSGFDELQADSMASEAIGQLTLLEQEMEDGLRAACDELVRLVTEAEAPRVAILVRRVLGSHARVRQALRSLCVSRGWPRLDGVGVPGLLALPPAAAVVAGRHVRLQFRERWVDGAATAASELSTQLTARVETQEGVFFPSAMRAEVAFVAPETDELLSQLRAALAASDSALAQAWLACCVAREVKFSESIAHALAAWYRFD